MALEFRTDTVLGKLGSSLSLIRVKVVYVLLTTEVYYQ